MRDYERTVLSQYTNSPVLCQWLDNFNEYIDPQADLQDFFDKIWNIQTAEGYGLDVWGRIVGVNRVLKIASGKYFGFDEATPVSADPFNQSPYFGGQALTENFALSDQAYRLLIMAKAAANITNGSIPAINRILMALFPDRGNAYVTEGSGQVIPAHFGFSEAGDAEGFGQQPFSDFIHASWPSNMTMTYTFDFPLEPFEVSIVTNSGVLPKSTGVTALSSFPL